MAPYDENKKKIKFFRQKGGLKQQKRVSRGGKTVDVLIC